MENGHGYLVFFKKNGDMSPHYELSEGELCIGSNTGNEIRLKNDNPLLMGVHAVVKINAEGIATISSKSQEAPVIVNNEPVPDSRILKNLDIFEILGKKFQYFNENVPQETVKELEENKEVPAQVKSKPAIDITRKSCMPVFATASPKKNSPPTVKTKTPIRKSVSKKSISENNPNGVQAIITPNKKPDKRGSSKTTSKIIVSKALGSPGNKRRTRLSLGEVPSTSETREMISSRNVLLSKSTINITISQTHEYSPLESPRVQNILSNGVYTTKSGRTPKKSTRLIEIEEPTKKSGDLINLNTPDKDETASPTTKSTLKGTSPTPKTPMNKRLLLLKGTDNSSKKDTPPPGKGSPLIMVKANRSQSKHSVKRLIKITSPKEKGNISVTFSPNFDTPTKQGSILKKTETPVTANKSRVSFATNQSISYFQNDSSIEDDMENNKSNDEVSEKEKVLLVEHNYSTPLKAKGRSIRNTSTPLSASSKEKSASSDVEVKSPRKSITKRSLSSSEFDNQINQSKIGSRKSQLRQSRSFSANDDVRSEANYSTASDNRTLQDTTEADSRKRQKSGRFSTTFDASTQLAPNDSQLGITSSTSPTRATLRKSTSVSQLDNTSPAKGKPKKSINSPQVNITSTESPTRGRLRKSVNLSQNESTSDSQDESANEDASLSKTVEQSINQVSSSTRRPRKSAVDIDMDSLVVGHDDCVTEDSSISKELTKTSPRKSRQSSWGFDESLRLQSDPDSPRKSSARRSTLGNSKGNVSTYEVDFSQEEHIDSSMAVANADISRQSRRHDESSIKILDMDTQEIIKSSRVSKRSRSLSTSKLDDSQEVPKSSPRKSKNISSLNDSYKKNVSRRSRSFDTSVSESKASREIIYDDGEYLVCVESSRGDEQDIHIDQKNSFKRSKTPRKSNAVNSTLKESTFNDVSKISNKSNRKSKSVVEDFNLNLTTDDSEPENNISRMSTRKSRSVSDDTDFNATDDSVFEKSNYISGRQSRSASQDSIMKSKNLSVSSRKSNLSKANGRQSRSASQESATDDSEIEISVIESSRKSKSIRKSNVSGRQGRSVSQESVTESSDIGGSPERSNVSRRSNISSKQSRSTSQESATEDEGVEVSVKESPIKSVATRKSNVSRRQTKLACELSSTENVRRSNARQSMDTSNIDIVSEAANVSKRRSVSPKKNIVAGRSSTLSSQGSEMSKLEISVAESVRQSNARPSNSVSKDEPILGESNNRHSVSPRKSMVSCKKSLLSSQGSEISKLPGVEVSVKESPIKSVASRKSNVSRRQTKLACELSSTENVRRSNARQSMNMSNIDIVSEAANVSKRRSVSPKKNIVAGRSSTLSSQGSEMSKLEISVAESVRQSNARPSNSVSKDEPILEESNNRHSVSPRKSMVSCKKSLLSSQGSEISKLPGVEVSVKESPIKSVASRKSNVSRRQTKLACELSSTENVRRSNARQSMNMSNIDIVSEAANVSKRRSVSPKKNIVAGRSSTLSSQGSEMSKLEISVAESVRQSNARPSNSVSRDETILEESNNRHSVSPRKNMVSGKKSLLSSQGSEISKLEFSENENIRKSNAKLSKSLSKIDSISEEANISKRRSTSRKSHTAHVTAESGFETSARQSDAKLSESLSKNQTISEEANMFKHGSISTRKSLVSGRQSNLGSQGSEMNQLEISAAENVRKSSARPSNSVSKEDTISEKVKRRSTSPRKRMASGRKSQLSSQESEISKLELSENEYVRKSNVNLSKSLSKNDILEDANISIRRSVSPRKSQTAHVTAESVLETSVIDSAGVTDASIPANASSRKSRSMLIQTQAEDSNISAISALSENVSKCSSKSTRTSISNREEDLSPIKAVRSFRSSARRNVLNDSSLTSAEEEQSSSSVLTISSQSFSSFKKSEDLSHGGKSTASTRTSKTASDISNDSVFLNESVKSNQSIKFGDNVSLTSSTPFHKKMKGIGLSDESEIINVTSTSSVLAAKEPKRRSMRSEVIYTISDSTTFESPIKSTSGRVSRQSSKSTTPLMKKKSVTLEPQTPEMNREVDDETPKSHVKPRRSSKSVYNPVTEDITPVTPEKLMISQQGENVFKTPINTPGLFESIRKSVIRSRKRARESQGSALRAKRPRVEFDEDTSVSQDEESAAATSTTFPSTSTPQPKVQKSPKNRLTNFEGVKRLMRSPQKSPKNDLRNVPDLRPIMTSKTPKNDLRNVPNLRRIMSPRNQNSPLNDLTKPVGIKNLMKTPGNQKTPLNELSDLEGVAGIFNVSSLSGVESLHQGSDIENYMRDDLFTQISGKRAPRTYHSASPKKTPQKEDTRKTYHDIPESSPRVEKWVEEQAKRTTEPPLPAKSKRKSSVNKNINTPQKEVASTTEPSPVNSKRKSSVKGTIKMPQKLAATSEPFSPVRSKRKSSMKTEIDTPEKQVAATVNLTNSDITSSQKRKSLKKELLIPVPVLANPQLQALETSVEQTKDTLGKKIQKKTATTKPKPSGRRKRILSEEDINTMISIELLSKKGRARRVAKIAENPTTVKVEPLTETQKGRKAVSQKVKVVETNATEEDFKKPTAPKRGARNAKKEEVPSEESEQVATKSLRTRQGRLASRELESSEESDVSGTLKPVRRKRNKAAEIEQVEELPKKLPTRGKNKQQSESEVEIAPTETETEPAIKKPIRGRKAQIVAEEVVADAETLKVDAPKRGRGGKKEVQESDTSSIETPVSPKAKRGGKNIPGETNNIPVADSPKKKRGGRNQPKNIEDIASIEVEAPVVNAPTSTRRRGRRQASVELAESIKEDTPVVEKKKGGIKAHVESLKDETLIADQKKVAKGKVNQANKAEDIPTENTAEPVKKVSARVGRGRQKEQSVDETKSVEVPELIENTAESPKKVSTRAKIQPKEKIVENIELVEGPTKRATRGNKQVESVSQEPEESKQLDIEVKKPRARKAAKVTEKVTDDKEKEDVEKQKPIRNKKEVVEESTPDQQKVPEKKPTRGRKQQLSTTVTDSIEIEPIPQKTTRGKRKMLVTDEVAEDNKKPVRGRKKAVTEAETQQDEKEEEKEIKKHTRGVKDEVAEDDKKPVRGRKKTVTEIETHQEEKEEEEIKKRTRGGKNKLEDAEGKKTVVKKPKSKLIEEIKVEEAALLRSPRSKKGQNSKYPPEVFETPEKKLKGKRVHFEEAVQEKSSSLDEGTRRSKRSKK